MLLRALWLVLLTLSLVMVSGCGDEDDSSSDDGGTITATFSSIYSNLLSNTCLECHIPGGVASDDGANFDLTSQTTAYSTLSSNNFGGLSSTGCTTVALVDAGSSSTSGLVAVLFSDLHSDDFAGVSGCTPYTVHHSDQNLSTAERNAILDWIDDGAPNN